MEFYDSWDAKKDYRLTIRTRFNTKDLLILFICGKQNLKY